MNHDEFDRLAESAFDDPAPRGARERVEALAATDPELRVRWECLLAARSALANAGLEPLPAGLHDALIGTVRDAPALANGRGSWLSFITAAIQVRPAFALGGAVAAGLAIGVIGIGLLMGGLRTGTDLAPGISASLPPMPPLAATTSIDEGGARLDLTARPTAGGTVVGILAGDGTPATVTFHWDAAALRLTGIGWASPDAPSFQPAPGRVSLRLPEASGSELMFDEIVPGGSAIRATLSAAGGEREATLRMPRQGERSPE